MTDATRPFSIRLAVRDIDHLAERAKRISGTPTGVARELILSGLTDGDPFTQAARLLTIERKLASISQDVIAATQSSSRNTERLVRIETMFEELLRALAGNPPQGSQPHA